MPGCSFRCSSLRAEATREVDTAAKKADYVQSLRSVTKEKKTTFLCDSVVKKVNSHSLMNSHSSSLRRSPIQPQLPRDAFHGLDAKRDVLFQVNSQVCRTVHNVRPVHAARERLVFQLPFHRRRFHLRQRLPRLDQSTRRDESRQFIAREQRFLHRGVATDAAVLRVRHDGATDLIRISALFQNLVSFVRMILNPRVAIVVEVVQQSHNSP